MSVVNGMTARRSQADYSPMLTPPIFSINMLYITGLFINLATLCLNGTLSCVDLVDVIMGDIPPLQARLGQPPPPPQWMTVNLPRGEGLLVPISPV